MAIDIARPVRLDVWIERFETTTAVEVRWLATGAKGEQPYAGSDWCETFEEVLRKDDGLERGFRQLSGSTTGVSRSIKFNRPAEGITHIVYEVV